MKMKSSTLGMAGGIFSYRGLQAMNSLCIQHTSRTAQTAIEMAPMAGKHDSNEDKLGMELVYDLFTDKS